MVADAPEEAPDRMDSTLDSVAPTACRSTENIINVHICARRIDNECRMKNGNMGRHLFCDIIAKLKSKIRTL